MLIFTLKSTENEASHCICRAKFLIFNSHNNSECIKLLSFSLSVSSINDVTVSQCDELQNDRMQMSRELRELSRSEVMNQLILITDLYDKELLFLLMQQLM